MRVPDIVKSWIVTSTWHEDSAIKPSFYHFLRFLQYEQSHEINRVPGRLYWEPVPGTNEEWTATNERLQVSYSTERDEELIELYYKGDWHEDGWAAVLMKAEYGPNLEIRDQDLEYYYLHERCWDVEPQTLWALTHPTAEDIVVGLSKLPYDMRDRMPVVVHIAEFDDLQAGAEARRRPGYKIIHNVLRNEILVSRIEYDVPETRDPGMSRLRERRPCVMVPPRLGDEHVLPPQWGHPESEGHPDLLFCGSPAALATLILDGGVVIAAEFMVSNALAFKWVQFPEEHRGTFTTELRQGLHAWLMGGKREALKQMEFLNRWRRDMVDLTEWEGDEGIVEFAQQES
ncbi:hypothetical protein MMC30_000847 [Trapelia coarctata]|nr:hypothetical protein [Trapelia coarctata]